MRKLQHVYIAIFALNLLENKNPEVCIVDLLRALWLEEIYEGRDLSFF